MFHNTLIMFNYFAIINKKLIWNNFLIIIHARAEQYFLQTQNVQCAWWNMSCLFSVDLMPIDVRIYMFLNKTPTNNFPFASFPLVQFLLIVLSVKVTAISNRSLAWVAYSQGRASAGSRAHLVIKYGPSMYLWRVNILTFPKEPVISLVKARLINNGYFTLINFGRDSPRADFPRSTTSNGQVTSIIGLSSTSPFDAQIINWLSSSTDVYGVCSRVFLVVHTDWVSNSALFDLNWAISNSMIF